ncbi:MAG: hypothetical protein K2N56_10695, partial [Oscillospiraceae bacterium]|nr:hypothetical protein [Oscillospiraceae bacterium]
LPQGEAGSANRRCKTASAVSGNFIITQINAPKAQRHEVPSFREAKTIYVSIKLPQGEAGSANRRCKTASAVSGNFIITHLSCFVNAIWEF